MYEAEVIEFWMRIYTPTLDETRLFISQQYHFNFTCNMSGLNFTVQNVSQAMQTLLSLNQMKSWIYVAGAIGFNTINCYFIIDDSNPIMAPSSPGLGPYQNNYIMFLPQTIGATRYLIGIREFKIWLQYKTYNELQSTRYYKPSRNAPGLALYLPLDETSGSVVVEKISGSKIPVNDSFWSANIDYLTIQNGNSQYNQKDKVALMLQDNTTQINLDLTNRMLINNELTFMIWFKMLGRGQLFLNLTGKANRLMAYIDLVKTNGFIETIWKNTKDVPTGSSPLVPGQWQSYAYSIATITRLTYVNAVFIRSDENPVRIIKHNQLIVC